MLGDSLEMMCMIGAYLMSARSPVCFRSGKLNLDNLAVLRNNAGCFSNDGASRLAFDCRRNFFGAQPCQEY